MRGMASGRSTHTASEARGTTNTQILNTVPNSFRRDERRWSSAFDSSTSVSGTFRTWGDVPLESVEVRRSFDGAALTFATDALWEEGGPLSAARSEQLGQVIRWGVLTRLRHHEGPLSVGR